MIVLNLDRREKKRNRDAREDMIVLNLEKEEIESARQNIIVLNLDREEEEQGVQERI